MPNLDASAATAPDLRAAEPDLMRHLVSAREHLLSLQDERGFFKGALETNVTMDAEDLLLREFLGIADATLTERTARWIRSQQADNGTWSNAPGAVPDLSTTVEAYLALRLAGDPIEVPHMARAARWIRLRGGLSGTRVFTRVWLALFGLWEWDALPVLPPEIMLLPAWAPLNIYDFACWARQTIVALSVVMTYRPARPLPIDLRELQLPNAVESRRPSLVAAGFEVLDRGLSLYAKRPIEAVRERALERAEQWIVDRQEADGSWGGIQPPWVYSLIALSLRGYPVDHPQMQLGLEGLKGFTLESAGRRQLEACQSPVWDTALAVQALTTAGVPRDDPRLARAAGWLLDEQVLQAGDWSVRRPDLPPGGWSFEFDNDHYPDTDDTAEVMLALRSVSAEDPARVETACARGARWVLGLQSRGGGWGAFDADNVQALCRLIPFCDFGEVIDEPSADVTAHVLEMLAREGLGAHPKTQAGLRWLLEQQESDGAWFGRWGVNYIYGTGAALAALGSLDMNVLDPRVDRGVRFLLEHQNSDGGWGESVRSYDEARWRGVGPTTPSQTAWALIGLLAVGYEGEAVERAVERLCESQREDGGWDEDHFTGTGFPGDFYIGYHLYRDVFPTMALGHYARSRGVPLEVPSAGRPHVRLERVLGGGRDDG